MGIPGRDRAVVIGAGMAGLFAARVLAESFGEVVVLDRDELPDGVEPRRRVQHGRHVHGLLAKGHQGIEGLFPGITAEFTAAGAVECDLTGDVRWVYDGAALRQPISGLRMVSASRPLLERVVRSRVEALPNVTVHGSSDVEEPVTEGESHRVTGVRVRRGDLVEEIAADLVVDAGGRGARTPTWLGEWGYGPVEEETFKIGIGYTTRHYDIPESAMGGDVSIHVVATPANPRGAVCARVDGGRVVVTAYGMNGDLPGADEESFPEFLRSLSAPDVADAVAQGTPLDGFATYRFPAGLRRRYERLTAFPEGLLVVGDAICSFNPTYAQGMTVSVLEALVLRDHLARPALDPAAYFADVATDAVDRCWTIATSTDLARSGRVDPADPAARAAARLLAAASRHDEVAIAHIRVVSLIDPAESLAEPDIAALVAREDTGRVDRVAVGDLVFDVRLAGPEDGEPVVLLHGWPHNFRSWQEVEPLLHAEGLRTIAPNQRGYSAGARPRDVADYRLPLLAGDVLGLLDALGVESAHVVGHDWGAIVAWYLAARHPERVRTLTATAFPHLDAYQDAYQVDPEQRAASAYIDLLTAPGSTEYWLADDARRLRELLALHDNALTPEQQARYLRFHTQPGTFHAALNWYRTGVLLDGAVALGKITVPTTFIWSEADASVSTMAAERTADYVSAPYRVVTLPAPASHWQPQEFPALVAAEVVARVRGGSTPSETDS
ncbi:alpha/beta fold hydrolase [Saccharothrix australiensis]|uniref:Pimeloyl-ACP methyl ester carboxylesterase n=1 Tax=Saccharothrix australiensis TaxID=2072 RepID=A0A495W085_9PSEU|nr:alpha/beta fold hydrolase [Saccharothrix australiensis]RKT54540.1 pimeloyl-ACP methyl ester carboxylesterase [Saccharothrix australiensis]